MFHLLLVLIYISFVSLGLPDALLGSAWPTMYMEFDVPVSYAGIISMIIAVGTVISSLLSGRLIHRLGTGRITAISAGMTAAAILGFAFSSSFRMLCLWAIPFGLGAGSVDASLNNYVALHYASRHMSWLHCMWGLGASIGPYIMGFILAGGLRWNTCYLCIGIIQVAITAVLCISIPAWKHQSQSTAAAHEKPLSLRQIIRLPGAGEVLIAFFCYCALEQTTALWASSYLVLYKGVSEEPAAIFASMFFIGITAGRALNGFLTLKFSDTQLIRMGQAVVFIGIAAMLLPMGTIISLLGLILIGIGCAPIYPCIIHSTPTHFGKDKSQALIGVQMASAYCGIVLMPPLFGLIANHISVSLLPVYLLAILAAMFILHERLTIKSQVVLRKKSP